MPESFENQLSRVRLMSEGDPTWDLSPNDQAALKAVLAQLHDQSTQAERMSSELRRCREKLRSVMAPPN